MLEKEDEKADGKTITEDGCPLVDSVNSVSDYISLMKKRKVIERKISFLKKEADELQAKTTSPNSISIEKKLLDAVSEALVLAYERLCANDFSALSAIAKYDKTGIFSLFRSFSIHSDVIAEKRMEMTDSGKYIVFSFSLAACPGEFRQICLPTEMVEEHGYGFGVKMLMDEMVSLCRKIIESLRKSLEETSFL